MGFPSPFQTGLWYFPNGGGDGSYIFPTRPQQRQGCAVPSMGLEGPGVARPRSFQGIRAGGSSLETIQLGRRLPGGFRSRHRLSVESRPFHDLRIRSEEFSPGPKGTRGFFKFSNSILTFFLPKACCYFREDAPRVTPWEPQGCYIALPAVLWIILEGE